MSRPRRRPVLRARERLGVRMRSALAAAAVVALAAVLSGIALVIAARIILTQNIDDSTTQRASQVTAAVSDGGAELTAVLRPSPRDRTIVQVIDRGGRVVAASASVGGLGPISPAHPEPGQTLREQRWLTVDHDERFQILATSVDTTDGPRTIFVAQSLDEVNDGTEAVVGSLVMGLPVLTTVVGVATFMFVGRSLHPVEAMRRQAATITAQNLHTRLPVPGTADEVAALATTMNTMLDRIEDATAAQRRFVADASHELRSPLATIHVGLEILQRSGMPEHAAAHLQRMHRESTRMAALIADLLLLARADESGLRLRHVDVDLHGLVCAERDRIAVQHPQLRLETHLAPTRVQGDPQHLQRVLRNVLDNAARHAASLVHIDLSDGAGHADLTVTDDGPGIPPADRERVFDRFVRCDDTRSRDSGGTGLGLAIARDIILTHGGTITVDDTPLGGAALHIRLPVRTGRGLNAPHTSDTCGLQGPR